MGIKETLGVAVLSLVCSIVCVRASAQVNSAAADSLQGNVIVVNGSFPKSYIPVPPDSLAFVAFAADESHDALHVMRASGELPEALVTLQREADVLALNDKYVIATNRGRFLVYSRMDGSLLARKMFASFPNGWAAEGLSWLIDDTLITAPAESDTKGRSFYAPRRIHLPDLAVTESYGSVSFGPISRWNDKFVRVAATDRTDNSKTNRHIVVFDSHFHMLADKDIGRVEAGCESSNRAHPAVQGDLLAVSFECGTLQVYDLNHLDLVAQWNPPKGAEIHGLAMSKDYVHAVVHHPNGSTTITSFALHTLDLIRTDSVTGDEVIVSGDVIYSVMRNTSDNLKTFKIVTYRIPPLTVH